MSAKLCNIRKYDSTEFSTLVEIYNQMARYLDPGAIEYTEEYASLFFSNMSDLSNYSLVFENKQNEIIGFALIMQFPIDKDTNIWNTQYGILPTFLKSELPGDLIEAKRKLWITKVLFQ